ncbi:MAG: hypothetical protein ABWK01_02110 [Infirmifilum sp.]
MNEIARRGRAAPRTGILIYYAIQRLGGKASVYDIYLWVRDTYLELGLKPPAYKDIRNMMFVLRRLDAVVFVGHEEPSHPWLIPRNLYSVNPDTPPEIWLNPKAHYTPYTPQGATGTPRPPGSPPPPSPPPPPTQPSKRGRRKKKEEKEKVRERKEEVAPERKEEEREKVETKVEARPSVEEIIEGLLKRVEGVRKAHRGDVMNTISNYREYFEVDPFPVLVQLARQSLDEDDPFYLAIALELLEQNFSRDTGIREIVYSEMVDRGLMEGDESPDPVEVMRRIMRTLFTGSLQPA